MLTPQPLSAFQDNYIWALSRGGEALVVDPGDADVVEAWLAREALQLRWILVTHHHADHVGGLARLRQRHHARVLGPAENIAGLDLELTQDTELELSPFGKAQVLMVPGHTRAHIAYYLPDERLLFCGDTLFSAGCGRVFDGSVTDLCQSVQRLSALPGDTRICCAHEYTQSNLSFAASLEPDNAALQARASAVQALRRQARPSLPVTLAEEQGYNPFLRINEASLRAALAVRTGRCIDSAESAFVALRALKDKF